MTISVAGGSMETIFIVSIYLTRIRDDVLFEVKRERDRRPLRLQ